MKRVVFIRAGQLRSWVKFQFREDASQSARLRKIGALLSWVALLSIGFSGVTRAAVVREIPVDVCVYGGTSGGVIAAVQAARMGKTVALVGLNGHLGGMSSSGLGWTDIGHVNGDSGDYIQGLAREFYNRIGAKYGKYPAQPKFEPRVAELVFNEMVQAETRITLYTNLLLTSVVKQGPQIIAARMNDGTIFRAKMFIDASFTGDLMAKANVTYTYGRESTNTYGESLNGVRAPNSDFTSYALDPYVVPGNPASGLLPLIQTNAPGIPGSADQRVQAYNFRLCLTTVASNKLAFTAPPGYNPAQYELLARYVQALVAANVTPSASTFFTTGTPLPNSKIDANNSGALSTDFVGESAAYVEADDATRAQIWQAHKNYQQGFLYFLQTDSRLPASLRASVANYGLCKDEFTDNGGWPYELYVREGRRMVSDYVMTQSNVFNQLAVPDSVGMAGYFTDSHYLQRVVINGGVRNEGNARGDITEPYPISYRSLVPKVAECANLFVPWCLSASHTAYSSIRMEPVFMILGQACGTAACFAIDENTSVQAINLDKLQAQLRADGQVLSMGGVVTGGYNVPSLLLDFGPTAVLTSVDQLNSPAHAVGGLSGRQTNWNTGIKADLASGLIYSDGTLAAGVSIDLGRSAVGGTAINFNDNGFISSNALGGSLSSGIYGGNSPVKDGFYGGTAANTLAVGLRVSGLPAGTYTVFFAARNTSTQFAAPNRVYVTNGPSAATYTFTSSPSEVQSNSSPANTSTFVDGDNCGSMVVTLGAGQSLFVAAAGEGAETRGFLNAVEIVPGLPVLEAGLPTVNLWSTDAIASRQGPSAGNFSISRTGDTNSSLTVHLSIGGTATNGQDYQTITSSVQLPAGVASALISVVPMASSQPVGLKTAIINLQPSAAYVSGSLTSAVIALQDVPLSDWRLKFFGTQATNPGVAGNQASPAGDGIPNLIKYALGLIPTNATAMPPLTPQLSGEGAFSISFVRPDPAPADIAYGLQSSANLSNWTDVAGLSLDDIAYLSNGIARVTYQASTQAVTGAKNFFRLAVRPN